MSVVPANCDAVLTHLSCNLVGTGDQLRFVPYVIEADESSWIRPAGSWALDDDHPRVELSPTGRSGLIALPTRSAIGANETVALLGYAYRQVLEEVDIAEGGTPPRRNADLRDGFCVCIASPLAIRETRDVVARFCKERVSAALRAVRGEYWPTGIDVYLRVFFADPSAELETRLLYQAAKEYLVGDEAAASRLRLDSVLLEMDPDVVIARLHQWLHALAEGSTIDPEGALPSHGSEAINALIRRADLESDLGQLLGPER